jgi:trimethylamine--corrinoid protein Co-methyltransferase
MTAAAQAGTRRSGRAARRAIREDRTAQAGRVVAPGMAGGSFRPLADRDVERIHAAALDVLADIGMADPIPEVEALALEQGCILGDTGRLLFPRALVEDMLGTCGREFVLHGREPAHDMEIGGSRVHFGTAGAGVQVPDFETGLYRPSTVVDLYDFARLVDQMANVHWFGRTVAPTELVGFEMDINKAYACAAGTTKHFGMSFNDASGVVPVVAMFDSMLGGEGRFRERAFCQAHAAAVVSPLRFGADNSEVALAAARLGMPLKMVVAAQAGATAPAALAGALVQTIAETLAAVLMVNFAVPGHPAVFASFPFTTDLRTGSFSGGSGEEALLNAAAAQVLNYYGLPSGVAAGMSDAKLPDFQAGYEKAVTTVLAGLAGSNLIYESAGMLASIIGCSFETLVMDNEMLGQVQRTVRGIEVSDETLSLEVIAEVADDPGHFLGHPQTLALMETEYLYPDLADRAPPTTWEEAGATDMRARARTRVRELLSTHYPDYIDAKTDAAIRERYPIRLERDAMRPDCGRW